MVGKFWFILTVPEIALGNFLEIAPGQISAEKQGSSNQIQGQNVETTKKNRVARRHNFVLVRGEFTFGRPNEGDLLVLHVKQNA